MFESEIFFCFVGSEEYRMQKMNQSVDNLSRTYGNGVRIFIDLVFIDSSPIFRHFHLITILMLICMQLCTKLAHIKSKHHLILGFK